MDFLSSGMLHLPVDRDTYEYFCRLQSNVFDVTNLFQTSHVPCIYSCFEKGCPTKPYATMPIDIMGNGGLWHLIEALGVSVT